MRQCKGPVPGKGNGAIVFAVRRYRMGAAKMVMAFFTSS